MNLIEYIRFQIQLRKGKELHEQKLALQKIYKDMERRGYNHIDIATTIQAVILNNIRKESKKLDDYFKE